MCREHTHGERGGTSNPSLSDKLCKQVNEASQIRASLASRRNGEETSGEYKT